MSDIITILSERIGSNPGGKCIVESDKQRFHGYFKFCYGSKIQGNSSFRANHQPIYEGLTFELIRELGLSTTDFYVLCNRDRKVNFQDWRRFMNHDPSGRDFYFVSRILPRRNTCSEDISNKIIGEESVYLNGAMVSDVIGKKQNYMCISDCSGVKSVVYLDLGCSFVYAKEGFLSLPHKLKFSELKNLRSYLRRLENLAISSRSGKVVKLAELVNNLQNLNLPTLHPKGNSSLNSFLSEEEIEEIRLYLAENFINNIPSFKSKGILIQN